MKKGKPQQIDASTLDTVTLEPCLPTQDIVSIVYDLVIQDRSKDIYIRFPTSIASFHADVFKHLEGDALRNCITTFIERIELTTEREKSKVDRKFVSMVDDSPKIEDIP